MASGPPQPATSGIPIQHNPPVVSHLGFTEFRNLYATEINRQDDNPFEQCRLIEQFKSQQPYFMQMEIQKQFSNPFFNNFPMFQPQLSPQLSPTGISPIGQTSPQLSLPLNYGLPFSPQFSPELMQMMLQSQLPFLPQQPSQLPNGQPLEPNQNKIPQTRRERKPRKQEPKNKEHQRLPAQPPPQQQQQRQQQPVQQPQKAPVQQQAPVPQKVQQQQQTPAENQITPLIFQQLQQQLQKQQQQLLQQQQQQQEMLKSPEQPQVSPTVRGPRLPKLSTMTPEMRQLIEKLYNQTMEMKQLMEARDKKLANQPVSEYPRPQISYVEYKEMLRIFSAKTFLMDHTGIENVADHQRKLEAEMQQIKVELYGAGHPLVLQSSQLQPETSQPSTSAQSSSQSSPNQCPPVLKPQIVKSVKKPREERRRSKSKSRQSSPKESIKKASPSVIIPVSSEILKQEVYKTIQEGLKNIPSTSQQVDIDIDVEKPSQGQELYDLLDELLLKTNDPLRNTILQTQSLTPEMAAQILDRLKERFGNESVTQVQQPPVSLADFRLILPDKSEMKITQLYTWLLICASQVPKTVDKTIQPSTSPKTNEQQRQFGGSLAKVLENLSKKQHEEERRQRIEQNQARDNEPSTSASWISVEDTDDQTSQKPISLVGSKRRKSDHRVEEPGPAVEAVNPEPVKQSSMENVETCEIPKKKARIESSENVVQPISLSSSLCVPFQAHVDNQMDTTPTEQVSPVGIEKDDDGTHMKENQRNRSNLNAKQPPNDSVQNEYDTDVTDGSCLEVENEIEVPMEEEDSQNNNVVERTQPAPVFIEKIPVEQMTKIHFGNLGDFDFVVTSGNESTNNNDKMKVEKDISVESAPIPSSSNFQVAAEKVAAIDQNEAPLDLTSQPPRGESFETVDLSEDEEDDDCVVLEVVNQPSTSSQTSVSALQMLAQKIGILLQNGRPSTTD